MRFKAIAVFGCALFLTFFVVSGLGAQDEVQPKAFFPETSHEFSPVLEGNSVVHEFVIQNKGTATLKVERVKTG